MPRSEPPDPDFARRVTETLADCGARPVLADPEVELDGASCAAAVAAFAVAVEEVAAAVPAGGRVGVFLPPSAAQALAILSVIGARRVPVLIDPWTAPARLAAEWHRLRLHALAMPSPAAADPSPDALPGPVFLLDQRGRVAERRDVSRSASGAASVIPPLPHPDTALILSTSGSTGDPKSVLLSRRGLAAIVDDLIARFGLGPSTVAAVTLPLHHTMALNTQYLPTLLAGGRSVFFASPLSLGRTYRDLLGCGATFVSLVSELLAPCRLERERRGLGPAVAVTEMQLSGGVIHGEHLAIARELFPNARLHKGYGLTEAIRVAMIDSRDPRFAESAAGLPLPGQEVTIRDDDGAVLPAGGRGRIWVRGPNVMLGYDGDGAGAAAALDPGGSDRDRALDTGDLGYLTADGRVVVEGRGDGVFKSYGRRIAAAEIERAALACPRVTAALCIAVPCPVRGMRPVLFVEAPAVPGRPPAVCSALEAALKGALEAYKVPREIVLVEALPRSAAGKASRRTLERLWREGPPLADLGRGPLGCRFKRLVSTGATAGEPAEPGAGWQAEPTDSDTTVEPPP